MVSFFDICDIIKFEQCARPISGGIGVIGCSLENSILNGTSGDLTKRIALICGTSSCHMAVIGTRAGAPNLFTPLEILKNQWPPIILIFLKN